MRYSAACGNDKSASIVRSTRKAPAAVTLGNSGEPSVQSSNHGPNTCRGHVVFDSLHQQPLTSRLPSGLFFRRDRCNTREPRSNLRQRSPTRAHAGIASDGIRKRNAYVIRKSIAKTFNGGLSAQYARICSSCFLQANPTLFKPDKNRAYPPTRPHRCNHNSGRFLNDRPLSTDAFAFRIAGSSNTCYHRRKTHSGSGLWICNLPLC